MKIMSNQTVTVTLNKTVEKLFSIGLYHTAGHYVR